MDIKAMMNAPLWRISSQPRNYEDFSTEERYSWVRQELATGNYESADVIGLNEIFERGMKSIPWNADYVMFRILLTEFDPATAAKVVRNPGGARFFLESYGIERSLPFVDDEIWFMAYKMTVYGDEKKATTQEVKKLLQQRGVERIAQLIFNKDDGAVLVEIFVIEATNHLSTHIAKQIKGKHLEESLGL